MFKLLILFFAVYFVASAFAPQAKAQEDSPLKRMMELNRSGKWEQAAQAAQQFLDSGNVKTVERCEAFHSLVYAHIRLDRAAAAQSTLSTFDKECRKLPSGHWLIANVAKLRRELAPQKAAQQLREDDFWKIGSSAKLGFDVPLLGRHRQLCERSGADACLVIRRGQIVQEWYSQRYRVPMMAMSSTKSVTGILVGMLIDDGKIKSIDEPVCSFISEWCAGSKAKVTLRHLLTMTSGLPRMYEEGVGFISDKNSFVINLPLADEPGKAWAYSNEGVQLLSPVLDKAAGEPIQDYARKRLFEPLGMRHTRLHLDSKNHAWTYADMETTARDFARLGMLMQNKGMWRNRRIVSEKWVGQSTEPSQNLNPGYGLLWWLPENLKGFAAKGYLDTNLYVIPEQQLIVVRMQSKPAADKRLPYEPEALPLFNKIIADK